MVKVVARNYILEENFNEAFKLYEELVESTRKEDGCIKYELFKDENNSKVCTMIEEWESREALDKHLKSKHFLKLIPKLEKFMEKEAEINVYQKLI